MSYLKRILIISFFFSISLSAYSQVDSAEVDDDTDTTAQIVQLNKITPHKRGVYKTYEEYINNSPSIDAEFTLTPLQISRNNTLIAEADVDYDGKKPKHVWGVSDGQYMYIRVMLGRFFKGHYFRLQCDGPSPYIYLVEKTVIIPTGVGLAVSAAVAATSATLPPFFSVSIVRETTNYMKPVLLATNARMKRYLNDYPDLLEAYEKEPKHNKPTKAKYLTEYNKRKLGKKD